MQLPHEEERKTYYAEHVWNSLSLRAFRVMFKVNFILESEYMHRGIYRSLTIDTLL